MVFSWASFTSVSGNDGCWATSLIKSKSRVENSESELAFIVVESASLPRLSEPPIERSSSLICLLVRVSVPSFATDAAICAMPGCASRSLAVVAERNVSKAVTFGTFGSGASTTVSPFESFFSVIFGRFSGRGGPGDGGVFCCAIAGAVIKTYVITISRFFISVPLGPCCPWPLLVRLGLGGLCFGNAIDHGAVRRDEILRGRTLDLRCGDILKRRQQRVDLLRIVAEQRERGEQMRLAE